MKQLLLLFILIPFINFSQVQIGQDINGEYGGYQSGNSISSSSDGSIVAVGSPYRGDNGSASGQVRVYENLSGVWTQIGQDINGELAYDRSGTSVSLSNDGSILAIGAPFNDGNGEESGHVRVYENLSGVWTQIGQDIDGEAIGDNSGYSVSLSGNGTTIAIGAPYNDGNGEDSTQVRIYENISGVWTQIGQDIDGETIGDAGIFTIMSVSLSNDGDIVAVGTPGNDGNGENSGSVRIYENLSGIWTQIGQDIDGEDVNNFSGSSVSLSNDGSILAIGAPFNNGLGVGFLKGQVRVYENVSGVWTQIGQDIDGENTGDYSGYSVNLSDNGDILVTGAPNNDGNGENSGKVRVYENMSGVWTQIGQDIDGEGLSSFSGRSVQVSDNGSIVMIGAPDNGGGSGQVRVYENMSGVWTQIGQDIDGEPAADQSGTSLSLSNDGNVVAIGARGNDGNGSESGHVRVYENLLGVWTQIGEDIDGEAFSQSGRFGNLSISGDGSVVAIGATLNDIYSSARGKVRIYKNLSGVWTQIGQDIDGEQEEDSFGYSISLSNDGNIIAIGAPNNDENGANSGHVRVYENINGIWIQIGQDIDGEASLDYAGVSVSLSSNGNIVAFSASGNDSNGLDSGHVQVYENISGVWTQIGQNIEGENQYDRSGNSISLSDDGNILAIGARGNDSAGHVRVYENISGIWTQIGQDIDGEVSGDGSGYSVSLSSDGSILAVGAPYNNENSGHVRIYRNVSGVWIQIGQDIDGEASGDNSGYNVSLSGNGAIIAISAPNNDGNGYRSGHVRVFDLSAVLSVEEINVVSSFKLYPNPAKNEFTVQLTQQIQLENINIYNNLGKLVLTSKKGTINTSGLVSGIYIVDIITNKGKTSRKLILD